MRLTFLGTRGNIDIASRRHRRHSAAMVVHRNGRVMIDCGGDWLGRLGSLRPGAIVLTHAHPDHAAGLRDGAPCPVFATAETWTVLGRPVADRRFVLLQRPVRIQGIVFEAFPVAHSIRAPAAGYRVTAGGITFFYVPDLAAIPGRHEALAGISLYVGDGARLTRPLVRLLGRTPIGHAPISAQLDWCAAERVPRAVFTHCGTGIVSADGRSIATRVRAMGRERGVEASVAHDGQVLTLLAPFLQGSSSSLQLGFRCRA